MDLKEFQKLTDEAKRITKEADKADGALAQLFKRLEKDYDCADEQQAAARLKAVRAAKKKKEEQFKEGLAKVKKEFPTEDQ